MYFLNGTGDLDLGINMARASISMKVSPLIPICKMGILQYLHPWILRIQWDEVHRYL